MRNRIFIAAIIGATVQTTAAQADIRPLTGLWQGEAQLTGHSGCPPEMAASAPSDMGYAPRRIEFPDVFDGSAIPGDFTWVRVAENHWRAQQTQNRPTPMGALRMSFTHNLHVDSETDLRQLSTVNVSLPQAMAQMLGTGADCTLHSRVDHHRVGD